jgi:hypothetical protein
MLKYFRCVPEVDTLSKGSSLKSGAWGLTASALAGTGATVALLLAPSASASTYTDSVASQMAKSHTHVFVDPKAAVQFTPADVQQLNSLITGTHRSIFVVSVDDSQSGGKTGDALVTEVFNSLKAKGVNDAAVAVFHKNPATGRNNIDALGFGREPAQVQDAARSAASRGGRSIAVADNFVNNVAHLQLAGQSGGNRSYVRPLPPPTYHNSPTPWGTIWEVIGVIGLLIAGGFGLRAYLKRRRTKADLKEKLVDLRDRQTDFVDSDIYSGNDDFAKCVNSAGAHIADAASHLKSGKLDEAAGSIKRANRAQGAANGVKQQFAPQPLPKPPTSRPSDAQPQKATFNGPSGQTVVINNTTVPLQSSAANPYFYGGGMANNFYLPWGFYPYPVWGMGWGYSDPFLLGALAWNNYDNMVMQGDYAREYSFDHGYDAGYMAGQDTGVNDQPQYSGDDQQGAWSDAGNVNGGDFDDNQAAGDFTNDQAQGDFADTNQGDFGDVSQPAADQGNGDFGGGDTPSYDAPSWQPDPTPTYDPPSYDFTPTYDAPSFDTSGGGGFDFGS